MAKKSKKPSAPVAQKPSSTEAQYDAFAEDIGLSYTAKPARSNPEAPDLADADHWTITLRRGKGKLVFPYSVPSAHGGKQPSLFAVLCCLAIDANTRESTKSFKEWSEEWGFIGPMRERAQAIYDSLTKRNEALKALLSEEHYRTLLSFEGEA